MEIFEPRVMANNLTAPHTVTDQLQPLLHPAYVKYLTTNIHIYSLSVHHSYMQETSVREFLSTY